MTTGCISQQYSESLRNQFYQSEVQQTIVFVLSPFIYLSAIISIRFLVRGKKQSEPPADILLFICIFGLMRITSYLAAAIYDNIHPPQTNSLVPQSFEEFCDGTGFINVMCELADLVYNVVFCIYYLVKIRNPLKCTIIINQAWIQDNKELHVFCIVLILVGTVVFYLADLIGVSILGVCGYKIGAGIIFLDCVFTVSYFIVMVISSIFFVKYLKTISRLDLGSRIYFRFYFKYLIISSVVYLIGLVSLFVATIKCIQDQADSTFEPITIVCNVSRLLSPVMVLAVMINHPELKVATVLKYFSSCCPSMKENDRSQNTDLFYDDLMTTKRTSVMIELNTLNKNNIEELDYLSKIKDHSKACLINTILGCISLEQIEYLERHQITTELDFRPISLKLQDLRLQSLDFGNQDIFGWNYAEQHQFQLTNQIVLAYKHVFTQKMPAINLKFISFSSSVFKNLQKKEKFFDLYDKILPINNQKNIIENVQNDGGRSGQFFFFNFDRTLIIKTITDNQLTVLKQRIQPYFKYFQRNSQSFIVKILGLYKVANVETKQQISFMLMSNILKNIPKKYILKSYDMKGSSYQRQVLTNDEIRQSHKVQTSKTLKDMDFHVLQGRVHVSKEDSDQIKKIIEKDVSFLCSQGLIDYSLILLKLNYEKFCEESDIKVHGVKTFNSTKEKGVVYIFGLIDYLETWNLMKKGEKWYKSIFNKQQSISSQDPKFYAERFMKNLIMMILP